MRFLLHTTLITILALSSFAVNAQDVRVSGVVRDVVTNEKKAGVTISASAPLRNLTSTNEEGEFTVTVAIGTELVFSSIGYEEVKRKVTGAAEDFDIFMPKKENPMDQVVVQGFKTKSRETATGSSTVLSGKAVQDVPVANVVELLQGKVAGLDVQNNSGSPGGMGTINLRGASSVQISADGMLTPTSPLFIIDGVPVDMNSNYEYGFQTGGTGINPLAMIPPEDIEQFEVLRDAAATSQYGSRAAYGVILVVTKRGKSKVPIVQYSGNVFVRTPPRLRPVIGGMQERMIRINTILNYDTSNAEISKALINSIPFLADSLNPYWNNSTNWQDYYFRTTFNHSHNINIGGGDQTFNYKTNLNYYSENGIIQNTGFDRYNLSMNALYEPTAKFKMIVNLQGSLGQRRNGSGVGLFQTGLANSASSSSLLPPPSLFSANNSALATSVIRNSNKTSSILSSLDLQYSPVEGVRFINLLSYSFNSGTSDRFTPSFLNLGSSESYSYNDRRYNIYNRTTLYLNTILNDVHNISGYAFNEINSDGFRANAIRLSQTPHDQIEGPIGYNWRQSGGGTLNNTNDRRQHAYGGSFSYNYDRKYVIDLNYRLDGTSTNGPSQGYTHSPSISARWNMHHEKFFEKTSWLSSASLRGSWGQTIRPTGSIFDVYGKYVIGPNFNNDPTVFIDFETLPNVDFMPEINSTTNLGLELFLFQNRLEFMFDTYYRSIDNQIEGISLGNTNGFTRLQTNAVSLVNYGFEWTARVRVFAPEKPVQWLLSFTPAINKSVLTKLPNGVRQLEVVVDGVPIIKRLGRNPFSNLLYHTQGVYATDGDVPVNISTGLPQQLGDGSGLYFVGGDPHWTDVNGDYIIDQRDRLPLGNPQPLITGGFSSEASWMNKVTLRVNTSFTLVRDVLNNAQAGQFQNYTRPTIHAVLLPIDNYNYWTPTNTNAQYPNPYDFRRAGNMQPFRTDQTLFLEDGSYVKINNITLMYNFDRKKIERYGMSSCRLIFSANNVYTFSKYTGPDPELVTALGRDYSGGYPNARGYSFGVNVQF